VRLTFLQGRWNKQRRRGIRKERIEGKKKERNGQSETWELRKEEKNEKST
jgi:hypothetical protein